MYSFDELSYEVQNKVLNDLRPKVIEQRIEDDWDNISKTIDKLEDIAGIKVDLESSSQGHYYRSYRGECAYYPYSEEVKDIDKWKMFMYDVYSMKLDVWSDDLVFDIFIGYTYDDKTSFASNFAQCLVYFCNKIERDYCDDPDDMEVGEFIERNGYQFLSDGRVCDIL
ncbi:MAG: hypothetical protein J5733_05550 [Bacteroidaceae bacterium]|nr:hypothetical protein [Bacteroidaceae bacterium]